MHPESLANYKLQVYNPGSPFPSPQSEHLRTFPTTAFSNPDNPLKITFSTRKRGRSRDFDAEDSEDSTSPRKKPKMMKQADVKALFRDLRNETKNDMEEFKEGFAKTFSEEQAMVNAQTNIQFSSIQNQLTAIVQARS